ncbi:MAG: BatD family protein, partial [Chitinophagales bacterium]
MQRIILIVFPILVSIGLKSQVVFKAVASQQVVTVGESFQLQYILDDIEKDNEFMPPDFKGLRIVSGPYTYSGSLNDKEGSAHFKNIVFTLVSMKPGRFIIPGATAKVNGRRVKSDDIIIDVITKREALERAARKTRNEDPSEYFLRPGEDPFEKMRKNLFMKVLVDRRTCYVGQPVVATFKLYSRLESKSDIVKNPGFYGFTVQDIVNLNDNIARTEIVSGKAFDVHTIRIVQLYPLREGMFTIDAMEVANKVEFSKSIVNKKPEQEIIEGVVESNDPPARANTISYENHLSTEKIEIRVKPYPASKKPSEFNGATGNFSIGASLEKNELS